MKLIVCIDEQCGMMFLKRRQSQDSAVRRRMLSLSENGVLWMNGYSARQFAESAPQIRIAEDCLQRADVGDYCFVEDLNVSDIQAEQLIVYHWNRRYPSDVKFPMERFVAGKMPVSVLEFPGSSHERITEEIYDL